MKDNDFEIFDLDETAEWDRLAVEEELKKEESIEELLVDLDEEESETEEVLCEEGDFISAGIIPEEDGISSTVVATDNEAFEGEVILPDGVAAEIENATIEEELPTEEAILTETQSNLEEEEIEYFDLNTEKELQNCAAKKKKKKSASSQANRKKRPVSGKGNRKTNSKGSKKGNCKSSSKESNAFYGFVKEYFEDFTVMDGVVAGFAVLILILGIVTASVYTGSKAVEKQLASFVPLGEEMSGLAYGGKDALVAMTDAKKAMQFMAVEEETEEEEEEKEDNENSIQVNVKLSSIQKDLKIKFVNEKTGKLVSGVPFKVTIKGGKGNTIEKEDTDQDGIIYLTNMAPGDITVTALAVSTTDKNIAINTAAQTICIKKNIEYKKVDVADEVKKESEVNAKVEDTAVGTAQEGALKDTVEWVPSTKEQINSTTEYQEIDKSKVAEPKQQARAKSFSMSTDLGKAAFMTETSKDNVNSASANNPQDPSDESDNKGESGDSDKPGETGDSDKPVECKHSYILVKTTATCTEAGKNYYECEKCKDKKEEDAPALGHDIKDGKCTRCGYEEKPSYDPKTDKDSKLTDKSGNAVYVREGDNYRQAVYADYYVSEKLYIKSENTEYRYTGWQSIGDKTYFFNKDGQKVTGEQVIQGAKYNFASDGSLIVGSGTLGIDVSKWNGNIDWNGVKNSGVSYVIIRCGYRGSTSGSLIEDPKFKANIQGASKAGLKVGIYFFTQAISEAEAVEEASMTINLIKNYAISYPVFLDVEASHGRADGLDPGTRTNIIKAYCETIRNSGYTAGVYANKTWLNSYMHASELNKYKIWLAQYNSSVTYGGKYDLWQYSSKGSVSGIGGNTDMNLSYLGY